MSEQSPIPTINSRGLKDRSPKDYRVRFGFGAAISLIAALIGLKYPLFGGMFLAFPAILPASLTLIQRDARKHEAAIDAEGAIIGAIGLLAFALVVAFGIKPLGAGTALIAAALTWLVVSVGIYAAVMTWRAMTRTGRERAAPE